MGKGKAVPHCSDGDMYGCKEFFSLYYKNAFFILYIVYKHFDRSLLHVKSSNPTCLLGFRYVPFEMLRLNKSKKMNRLYTMAIALILLCQNGLSLKGKV